MTIKSLKNVFFEGEELTSFTGPTELNDNIYTAFYQEIRGNLSDNTNQYKVYWDLNEFFENEKTFDWNEPHKITTVFDEDKKYKYNYFAQFTVYNKKIAVNDLELKIVNRPVLKNPTLPDVIYHALATDNEENMYIVEWNVLNIFEPFKIELTVDYSRYCKKCLQVWMNKNTPCTDDNGHDYVLNTTLENVMDTKEAAELWGLSQDYIKGLCQKGIIRAKKIGRSWAIDKNQPNPKKYNV